MFKKLIKATVAASLVATPMIAANAQAQTRHQERQVTTVKHRPNGTVVQKTTVVRNQPNYRSWRKGDRFERRYARNYRVIDYRQYRGKRLYAPARGQQWVRSGWDAVLLGSNGRVLTVVPNAFR
jgi:Ni/Co efflux regulator RcnB